MGCYTLQSLAGPFIGFSMGMLRPNSPSWLASCDCPLRSHCTRLIRRLGNGGLPWVGWRLILGRRRPSVEALRGTGPARNVFRTCAYRAKCFQRRPFPWFFHQLLSFPFCCFMVVLCTSLHCGRTCPLVLLAGPLVWMKDFGQPMREFAAPQPRNERALLVHQHTGWAASNASCIVRQYLHILLACFPAVRFGVEWVSGDAVCLRLRRWQCSMPSSSDRILPAYHGFWAGSHPAVLVAACKDHHHPSTSARVNCCPGWPPC